MHDRVWRDGKSLEHALVDQAAPGFGEAGDSTVGLPRLGLVVFLDLVLELCLAPGALGRETAELAARHDLAQRLSAVWANLRRLVGDLLDAFDVFLAFLLEKPLIFSTQNPDFIWANKQKSKNVI